MNLNNVKKDIMKEFYELEHLKISAKKFINKYDFDKAMYVVGNEQQLHFKQVLLSSEQIAQFLSN